MLNLADPIFAWTNAWNCLISTLSICGDTSAANEIFSALKSNRKDNIVTWNSIINSLVVNDEHQLALDTFHQLTHKLKRLSSHGAMENLIQYL